MFHKIVPPRFPLISQAKRIRHNKTSVIGLFSLLVGVLLLVANIGLSVVYPKRKVHVLFPPTAQSIFVSGAKKGGVTSSPRIKGPWPLISHITRIKQKTTLEIGIFSSLVGIILAQSAANIQFLV